MHNLHDDFMPRFDLPLSDLRSWRPEVAEPADFDEFWNNTLAESRAQGGAPEIRRYASPIDTVDIFDITFSGFLGEPVKAWLYLPLNRGRDLPAVVRFHGYGGGRGLPHEDLIWASCGYPYLVMDTRGQGSAWSAGATADPHGSDGPSFPGFMTKGIESAHNYYYRRVFTDAVCAVDVLRGLPEVDADRICTFGSSQGGGIALAAAALADGVAACLPEAPFLCHFRHAVGMTDAGPYGELTQYLAIHRDAVDRTFHTLSYFDGVNFARRISVPTLLGVGLMDPICPPSTAFAVANHLAGEVEVCSYEFNEHEAGGATHWVRQAEWLGEQFAHPAH